MFAQIIEDDEFPSEVQEADRPVSRPNADAQPVQEAIERNCDTLNQEPYSTALDRAFE